MGHKKSTGHRLFDAATVPLYAAGTLATGGVTVAAGVGTVACAAAAPFTLGASIVPGAVCLGLTYVEAGATTYFGSKTIHKTSHVAGGTGHCHSLSHAAKVMKL
jgi:hypothetical protein